MVGFSLMISGGNEEQVFWFFTAILEKTGQFDGLAGFYENGFPLLLQYLDIFDELFQEYIPDLHQWFEYNDMVAPTWS